MYNYPGIVTEYLYKNTGAKNSTEIINECKKICANTPKTFKDKYHITEHCLNNQFKECAVILAIMHKIDYNANDMLNDSPAREIVQRPIAPRGVRKDGYISLSVNSDIVSQEVVSYFSSKGFTTPESLTREVKRTADQLESEIVDKLHIKNDMYGRAFYILVRDNKTKHKLSEVIV